MKLKDAIKRAAKFVGKEGSLSGIHFCPAVWRDGDEPEARHTFQASPPTPGTASRMLYDLILASGDGGLTVREIEDMPEVQEEMRRPSDLLSKMHAAGQIVQAHMRDDRPVFVVGEHAPKFRHPLRPAYVHATDGTVGVRIPIDAPDDVPNCIVAGKALAKVVTALKNEPFKLERTSTAFTRLLSESGKEFFVGSFPPEQFPPLPEFPEQLRMIKPFSLVNMVTHAASDSEDYPELNCLHLTSRFTEATDQLRTARVLVPLVPNGRGYLVDKNLLKQWPRKSRHEVGFSVEQGYAFAHVNEELRYVRALDDTNYFQLEHLVAEPYRGFRARVDTKAVLESVKAASASSALDWVRFHFEKNYLEIAGLDDNMTPQFRNEIRLETEIDAPATVIIRGKLMAQSLKVIPSEHCIVVVSSSTQPLRIETHDYVENLEPLIPENTSVHANQ